VLPSYRKKRKRKKAMHRKRCIAFSRHANRPSSRARNASIRTQHPYMNRFRSIFGLVDDFSFIVMRVVDRGMKHSGMTVADSQDTWTVLRRSDRCTDTRTLLKDSIRTSFVTRLPSGSRGLARMHADRSLIMAEALRKCVHVQRCVAEESVVRAATRNAGA